MALFLKHDFFRNFAEGVKSKDENFLRDLASDELAKAIVFDRDHVFDFMHSQGIDIKKRKSDHILLQKIYENRKNKPFTDGLAQIVLENNEAPLKRELNEAKKFVSGQYIPSAETFKSNITSELNDQLSEVFSSFENQDMATTTQLVESHKNNKSMIQKEGGYYRKIIFKTAVISIGATALVTSAIFLGIAYYRKKGQKAEAAAIVNTMEAQPTAQPQAKPQMAAQDFNENNFGNNA